MRTGKGLTSLRKQVFSLRAPEQPRKDRTKMSAPARHMSQAGSKKKSSGSCTFLSFSIRMYVPIAITASPSSWTVGKDRTQLQKIVYTNIMDISVVIILIT